jgi:hypothetical protein
MVAAYDEYWSLQVRNTLEQARDAGVHLAFMSANIGYWRFDSSPRQPPASPTASWFATKIRR